MLMNLHALVIQRKSRLKVIPELRNPHAWVVGVAHISLAVRINKRTAHAGATSGPATRLEDESVPTLPAADNAGDGVWGVRRVEDVPCRPLQ